MGGEAMRKSSTMTALGKLLIKIRPEIAEELLKVIQSPPEESLDKMAGYFEKYCLVTGLPAEKIRLKGNKSSMEHRRLFIGAMLKVYHPAAFNKADSCSPIVQGFQKRLLLCFDDIKSKNMPQEVSRVIGFIRYYDDFRRDVLNIHSQIIQTEDGSTKGE